MGKVIQFPDEAVPARASRAAQPASTPATVIILPVVRIERLTDDPHNGSRPDAGNGSGRRRRRRAAR